MLGIQLPENIKNLDVMKKSLENGLIVGIAGNNTIRFTPPLIISKPEIKEAIDIFKSVLKEF